MPTKKKPAPKSAKQLPPSTGKLRLEWIDPATLDDNPANWRQHPAEQLNALEAVLEDPEIGWAGVLLYNERTSRLIDGHGRKSSWTKNHPGQPAPVLVGNWTEEAEKKILLSLDPIGSMAQANAEKLNALRQSAPLEGDAFAGLRASLDSALKDAQAKLKASQPAEQPQSGSTNAGEPMADQWKIIVECESEMQQTELLDRFDHEGLSCKALVG